MTSFCRSVEGITSRSRGTISRAGMDCVSMCIRPNVSFVCFSVAVIISAIFYSVFVLVPFGRLVIADVLLYSLALFLEFGALIQLRKREPSLRGAFRIPLGRSGVMIVAALPMIVLLGVIAISFRDGEYGVPALLGAAVAIALGPVMYRLARSRGKN